MIVNQWPCSQSCRSSCPLISNLISNFRFKPLLGQFACNLQLKEHSERRLPSSHAGGPLDYNYACESRQHAQPML